jgi:hypothetical protein
MNKPYLLFLSMLLVLVSNAAFAQTEERPTGPKDEDYIWKFYAETCAGIQITDSLNGSSPRANYHIEVGPIAKSKEWALNIIYDRKDRYVFRFPMASTDSLTIVPKNQFTQEISAFVLRYLKDEPYYVVYLVDADRDIFSRTGRIPRQWDFDPEYFDAVEFTLYLQGQEVRLVMEE